MEEKSFKDRLNRTGKGIWALFGCMTFACLFVLLGGIIALCIGQTTGGIICIVVGFLSLALFLGVGILLPYIQWKKGITQESVMAWQSGTLTDQIIKKDICKTQKTMVIGLFGMTALVLAIILPVMLLSDEITSLQIVCVGCAVFTFGWAVKEWIVMKYYMGYIIEEDVVIDSQIRRSFDVIDAATTHTPTDTPMFLFEKHGEYAIISTEIHNYYQPVQLIEEIQKGEEVYLIKSKTNNRVILHIYRKKYWTLEK